MKESVKLDILALPESSASVIYSLYEVFSSVGRMWSFLTGEKQTAAGFDVRIVSPVKETFFCPGGIPVIPHADLENSPEIEVIVIPDFLLDPDFLPDRNWEEAKKWLQSQYTLGSVLCSVCTGSVLLADTGLLNGREATTHWAAAQMIKSRCPDVKLGIEKILVAGDGDCRIITAGGASSWGELALYLINRYLKILAKGECIWLPI
jgi:transcriptional regulator GlxA family with amidase domain